MEKSLVRLTPDVGAAEAVDEEVECEAQEFLKFKLFVILLPWLGRHNNQGS